MNEIDLTILESLHEDASSGPWHVRHMDDEYSMSAVVISTVPDTGVHESMRADQWPTKEVVAATLIQQPAYVNHSDAKWDENAALIVALRNAAPELIRLARLGLTVERSPAL